MTSNEEERSVLEYLDVPLQMSMPIKYFSPREIQNEMKLFNPRKAQGYDLIIAESLQQLPKKNIVALTKIFNAIKNPI